MEKQLCIIISFSVFLQINTLLILYLILSTKQASYIYWVDRTRLIIFIFQHQFTQIMLLLVRRLLEQNEFMKWLMFLSGGNLASFAIAELAFLISGQGIFEFNPNQEAKYQEFLIAEISFYFHLNTMFGFTFFMALVWYFIAKINEVNRQRELENALQNLQSEEYTGDTAKDCSICLNDLKSERVYRLKCEHWFHKSCLVEWLKQNAICPLCRTSLVNEAQQEEES